MNAITKCRSCGNTLLHDFLDLGEQHLSDFRRDGTKTPKYPLVATFCERCTLVQLRHTTPQHEMYHDRYGFKSGVSDSIKQDLDNIVTHAFQYKNDPRKWLDIASNDGTLLSFVPEDVYRVGVDPVTFLCKEAEKYADEIVNDYFTAECLDGYNPFDVITSVSCFYDMPDPNKFVSDVAKMLDKNGVWIIQQNYLLTTVELSAVDNFCHEHLEYYTLKSLEYLLNRHGLEVNEVYTSMVNGGSLRTVVSHKGTFDVDESVYLQRDREEDFLLNTLATYKNFAEDVMVELNKLHRMVKEFKDDGKKVYILAASTRGATIWQSAEIDGNLVEAAVERNPAKVGAEFTAIGVPIISEEEARLNRPDYMIIGPWFFDEEIIQRESEYLRNGGKLIKPLPKVEIIDSSYIKG